MKQKYFLLPVLVGIMFFSTNVSAVIVQERCGQGYWPDYFGNDDEICKPCPSNYNNTSDDIQGTIEECCIDDMTYDAATDMCVPVASAGLTNSSACDTENLGTSTDGSTASVEAVWDANTININWYNGETRVAQTTCEYDGTITLPQEPTKVGYTFAGWVLKTD